MGGDGVVARLPDTVDRIDDSMQSRLVFLGDAPLLLLQLTCDVAGDGALLGAERTTDGIGRHCYQLGDSFLLVLGLLLLRELL